MDYLNFVSKASKTQYPNEYFITPKSTYMAT